MKLLSKNIGDLPQISEQIIDFAGNEKIWILEGEMGAGKTTLVKALCKKLGVSGNVQSPTFSIVNEYLSDNGKTIYHFDFYRLKTETEALDFGIEEYFDSENICLLEWAEKIHSLLPSNFMKIKIEANEKLEREISIQLF